MFIRHSLTTAAAVLILAVGVSTAAGTGKQAEQAKKQLQAPTPVPKAAVKATPAGKPSTPARPAPSAAQAAKPTKPAPTSAKPEPKLSPEEVVRTYLRHRDRKEDDRSYQLLSQGSKSRWSPDDWRSQARNVRATFGAVLAVAGEALLIGGGSVADSRIEKVTVKGDQATVKVRQYVPIPTDIVLVKENGQWRIDLQKTMGTSESASGGQEAKPAAEPKTETKPAQSTSTSAPPPPPPPDTTPQCRANARQIAMAIQLYALKNDGKLPDAANWTDAIRPLLTNPGVLKCPADTQSGHEVSFAMNQNLSGALLRDIKDAYKTVLLYESTTGKANESGRGETIPSPPRHTNGNVYIMADGTVDVKPAKPQF